MKVTIKGALYAEPDSLRFDWLQSIKFGGYVIKSDPTFIREHSFEVDIPDSFDLRAVAVSELERKRQELRAEFAKSVTDIERQINELTAITMEPQS